MMQGKEIMAVSGQHKPLAEPEPAKISWGRSQPLAQYSRAVWYRFITAGKDWESSVSNSAQGPWASRVFLNYLFGSTGDLWSLDYLIPLSHLSNVFFFHLLPNFPYEN